LFAFYQRLIELRAGLPGRDRPGVSRPGERVFQLHYRDDRREALALVNLGETAATVALESGGASWRCQLDAAAVRWGGAAAVLPSEAAPASVISLPPYAAALYERAV
jgi:hypothetical protein